MSGLMLPFLPVSRCVVIMTDEGVTVHAASGSKVGLMGTLPWKEAAFEEKFLGFLKKSGAASVLILNDAVEQHYRKEKVIVASAMDKQNIVMRRLNVAFPNFPIRSAMFLKGGTDQARASLDKSVANKTFVYLFAASPSTEVFSRLIKVAAQTEMGLSGYGLLPIESVGLVKEITTKLAARWGGVSGAAWSLVIGQHRGGGLRQIVVRGSELALTRVTPIVEPNPDTPEVWAGDVSQEMQATLSYLSRFGYAPEDGLNIVVIGDRNFTAPIENLISIPCNFEAVTASEAGKLLGMKIQADDGDHYADALHAGWVSRKLALDLPMVSKEFKAVSEPRKVAAAAMILLALGTGGALYFASDSLQTIYQTTQNLEVAQIQKSKIEEIYQKEVKRKEDMGIDVNLIKGALDITKKIDERRVDPLELLRSVSRELKDLRVDGFEFKNDAQLVGNNTAAATPDAGNPVSLLLKFSFAGTVDSKQANEEINGLNDRLLVSLKEKGYTAEVTKKPEDQTYKGAVEVEVGVTASKRAASERYDAQITITRDQNAQGTGS
ncbi:MAG: hypothetical protein WC043_03190 [Pseudobdellovibrionaceae bacterium]